MSGLPAEPPRTPHGTLMISQRVSRRASRADSVFTPPWGGQRSSKRSLREGTNSMSHPKTSVKYMSNSLSRCRSKAALDTGNVTPCLPPDDLEKSRAFRPAIYKKNACIPPCGFEPSRAFSWAFLLAMTNNACTAPCELEQSRALRPLN